MANPAGSFVWHDLMTSDPDGAMKFYGEVAGWGTQPFEGSPMPYTMWTNNGTPLGGVSGITDEMKKNGVPPSWLASVGVANVDETVKKAEALGGKTVVPAADIPGAGRYAVISDPQGVPIAIFAGTGEMQGTEASPPKNGEFSWHELSTSDSKAAFDFYSKLFGWEKTSEFDMGPMGVYQMYGQRGTPYGGMMTRTPEMPPPNWLCYIHVPDAKASAETIKNAGGKVMMGPMDVPGGDWITIATDPQGAPFAVHSTKPAS
jgi:predicted enzyme related to lactoylglutathione lyase